MAVFSSKSYRALKQLYQSAESGYNKGSVEEVLQLSNQALQLLSSGVDWPAKASITNEKHVYPANFLLFRVKSTIAIFERDARMIDSAVQEKLLDDLEEIWRLTLGDPTAVGTYLQASEAFADVCVFSKAKTSLQRAQIALDHVKEAQEFHRSAGARLEYAGAIGREADIRAKYFTDPDVAPTATIDCLEEALSVFLDLGDEEMIFTTKNRLARTQLHPLLMQDANTVEKSISYAYSALDNMPKSAGMERYMVLDVIGMAYAVRVRGNPLLNSFISLMSFEHILSDFSPRENANQWHEIVLSWLETLMNQGEPADPDAPIRRFLDAAYSTLFPQQSTSMQTLAEQRLMEVFGKLDRERDVFQHFRALKLRWRLSNVEGSSFDFDEDLYLSDLKVLHDRVDARSDTQLWVDMDWHIANVECNFSDHESLKNYVDRLIGVSKRFELRAWPVVFFETYLTIGACLTRLGRPERGYKYISLAVGDIFERVETDFRGFSRKLFSLPGGEKLAREVPIAALSNGDIRSALAFHDINSTSSLAFDLEQLFVIEQQANRRSLMQTYFHVKQGQAIVHRTSDRDYLDEVHRLDELQHQLDEVKRLNQEVLRPSVFKELDRWLPGLDCWLFIPMLGNDSSRFVLIPPHATTGDVLVSEKRDLSYIDALRILFEKGEGNGWASIHPALGKSDHNDDDIDAIESEFQIIQSTLWQAFGHWLVEAIDNHRSSENRQLVIINSGPLSMLPFGIARDEPSQEYLLDNLTISYVPSIYALISLKSRLKQHSEVPSFGAVVGREDPALPLFPVGASLSAGHFEKEYRQVLNTNQSGISDVQDLLKHSTHWHFSGHADFHWGDPSASKLALGDGELSVDLLEALAPGKGLRLVMLAACSTGLEEIRELDIERPGFSAKLLSLGALGVIVSLWPLQNDAAILISERFYYFYMRDNLMPADSLKAAQCWLREVTKHDLALHLDSICSETPKLMEFREHLREENKPLHQQDKPFGDPEYWSGLIYVGV